jgi:FHA domain
MSEHGEVTRRPARASLSPRKRKRWMIAGGAVLCWVILMAATGSLTGATILLIVLAAFGVVAVFGLRALGVTRDHPWIQRAAARPWRDGQDVLQIALRHLSEVFVVTPSGTLLAPNIVDLRMNPEDLRALGERMEPALVMASAAEVYQEQVAEHGARFARPGPAEVRMIVDPSVPPGRYRLRQGQPVNAGVPAEPAYPPAEPAYPPAEPAYPPAEPAYPPVAPDHAPAPELALAAAPPGAAAAPVPGGPPYRGFSGNDGTTEAHQEPDWAPGYGMPTIMERTEPSVPVLRLITGDQVAETRTSGARAGRGPVELGLPEVPTVSREHARFTFSGGRWRIANLGMNGLTVNGEPVLGEHPVSDGDSIRWGTRPDALASRVEIR